MILLKLYNGSCRHNDKMEIVTIALSEVVQSYVLKNPLLPLTPIGLGLLTQQN